jgi:hypothetical protein
MLSSHVVFFSTPIFITNKLKGQLGNQLYQISTGISLALDNNWRYILPGTPKYPEILHRISFGANLKIKNNFKSVSNGYDNTCNFISINPMPDMQLEGFFLSYKYFDRHKNTLMKLFAPTKDNRPLPKPL